jgi:hypothetical protein
MKWGAVAAGVAFVVTSACVPPPPIGLSHDFAVTYIGFAPNDFGPAGPTFQGTITNTAVAPADYNVTLVGSAGLTGSTIVTDVLVGQTAIWMVTIPNSEPTISHSAVRSSPKAVGPVSTVTTITLQRPYFGTVLTWVEGTLTNTGSSVGDFAIELQANSGAVTRASVYDVRSSQTVEWDAVFLGQGTARIVRTTILYPSP